MAINHIVDPTYFYDAINLFEFEYKCYVLSDKRIDEYGRTKSYYDTKYILGSLQSGGTSLEQRQAGNIQKLTYDFYCKSLYRINIGDVIYYRNNYLRCVSVQDYDEYGVRSAHLEMIQLSAYRDLEEYIKFEKGDELV